MATKVKTVAKKVPGQRAELVFPVPVQRAAIVAAVDARPDIWAATGLAPSRLQPIARSTADLSNRGKCFFCGAEHKPMDKKSLYDFSPDYRLCKCLLPYRQMDHDYIESWEGHEKEIVATVKAGTLERSAPVYQYMCTRCHSGPHIVRVGMLERDVLARGVHKRLRTCKPCYTKVRQRKLAALTPSKGGKPVRGPRTNATPLTATLGEIAAPSQSINEHSIR